MSTVSKSHGINIISLKSGEHKSQSHGTIFSKVSLRVKFCISDMVQVPGLVS